MLFGSAFFLFLFLPILLGVYYIAPNKFRNIIILFASLFFYAFGEKELVLLIIASIFIDFFAGILIESGRKKIGLYLSIIANIGILFYFKYSTFIYENFYYLLESFGIVDNSFHNIPNIVLPLGISFFTFQTMSYTIDVYRGNVKASRNIINFATYVTMFPQLIAGPIVRYKDIERQLNKRELSTKNFSEGIERFIIGLAKKIIIADNLAYVADGAFGISNDELSTGFAWVGVLAFTFQGYFDFSGYSDMAIGLGKMFGFDFLENFNYPYMAKSIKEFWHRWHISLSTWFRDYVYIPLGGNRKGSFRTYLNLFTVFFITGLWHGSNWNFIVWGLLHGMFIIIEKLGFDRVLLKSKVFFRHFYTMAVVVLTMVFFRANDLPSAFIYLEKMFSFSFDNSNGFLAFYLRKESIIAFLLALIFSVNTFDIIKRKMKCSIYYLSLKNVTLILLFIISIIYVAIDSYNPFIYFKF